MSDASQSRDPGAHDRGPPVVVTDEEVERLDPWDDGPPTRARHGENHTRRPVKTEVDRGQGPKTRAANRERVKGSRPPKPR
ncbi:MAG TPA: hypothetical protein VN694_04905 [Caulobacteraceae bacterium]|nr:hypothetical protein [Caulobacteraceae bacterium]